MSNLLAAVGRGQLQSLDGKVAARRAIKRRYRDAFADAPGIGFMPDSPDGEPTNWLTVVTVDEDEFGASPAAIREHLETLDIEARPAWKPMHLQPLFADCPIRGGRVAEEIFRTGSVPAERLGDDRRRRRPRRRRRARYVVALA